ncbi:hypothetical protein ACHAXA_003014, partial [Cyclostephanos tholiformis]
PTMTRISAAISFAVLAIMANLHTSAEAFSPSKICTANKAPSSLASTGTTTEPSPSSTPSPRYETVVIGGGRIGSLISANAKLLGRSDSISASIDPDGSGPIYVATRNDVLSTIVDECPTSRRKDLVFLQNGYLDDFLKERGLIENTQALLYLSVTARGVDPVDGITSVDPDGLTAATGVHATAFAERLANLGLKCKAGSEYRQLVRDVISELTSAVSSREGIKFAPGTIERLEAYTDVVSDFPCGVKEFEWRNRYFYDLGDDRCPRHNGLLRECAEGGKLGFKLPPIARDAPMNK